MKTCLLLNISQCDVSEKSTQFVVTVYNPLSRNITKSIRIPVTGVSYIVQDANGKKMLADMVPIPEPMLNIPGRFSQATKELVFMAENLPPLGFCSYYITKSNHIDHSKQFKHSSGRDIILGSRVSIFITSYLS